MCSGLSSWGSTVGCWGGSERGTWHTKQQMFTSEVLNRLSLIHSQLQPTVLHQPVPQMQEMTTALVATVTVSSVDAASAHGGGSQAKVTVAPSSAVASSSTAGEMPISWPWGSLGNLTTPAMFGAGSRTPFQKFGCIALPQAWGSGGSAVLRGTLSFLNLR